MLPDVINGQAHYLCRRYAKKNSISSREFCRHIPSLSSNQVASNKGC